METEIRERKRRERERERERERLENTNEREILCLSEIISKFLFMISLAVTSETFCHFWQKESKLWSEELQSLERRREVMYGLHVCIHYFTIMPLLLTVTISKTLRQFSLFKGHIRYSASDLVGSGGSDFANGSNLPYSIFFINIVTPIGCNVFYLYPLCTICSPFFFDN